LRARLKRELLVTAAAAAIALTFLALGCAGLFMRPLRRVVVNMKAGSGGVSASRIKIRGNDEFAELARGYNGMADAIEQRDELLAKAKQEKSDLLRSMYPSGVAERVFLGNLLFGLALLSAHKFSSRSRLRPWSMQWTAAGWSRATSAPLPKRGVRLSCR
jgi:methyl-accepting chemotaxis protein